MISCPIIWSQRILINYTLRCKPLNVNSSLICPHVLQRVSRMWQHSDLRSVCIYCSGGVPLRDELWEEETSDPYKVWELSDWIWTLPQWDEEQMLKPTCAAANAYFHCWLISLFLINDVVYQMWRWKIPYQNRVSTSHCSFCLENRSKTKEIWFIIIWNRKKQQILIGFFTEIMNSKLQLN